MIKYWWRLVHLMRGHDWRGVAQPDQVDYYSAHIEVCKRCCLIRHTLMVPQWKLEGKK